MCLLILSVPHELSTVALKCSERQEIYAHSLFPYIKSEHNFTIFVIFAWFRVYLVIMRNS